MLIKYHNLFKKAYKKRIIMNPVLDKKTEEIITIFKNNHRDPILRDHLLKGKKQDLRAFSITGDIRIVYKIISKNEVLFLDIGSHNQVY